MKRIISLLTVLILVFSFASLTASADTPYATLSVDYTTLTAGGVDFTRVEGNNVLCDELDEFEIGLMPSQKKVMSYINGNINEEKTVAFVYLEFSNGSMLDMTFVRNDCLEEYTELSHRPSNRMKVNFGFTEENYVTAESNVFFGETVKIAGVELAEFEGNFEVSAESRDGSYSLITGQLYVDEKTGRYYHVNYADVGEDVSGYNFEPILYPELVVYSITDRAVIEDINSAMKERSSEEITEFFGDTFSVAGAVAVLVIFMGIIPLAVLIFSLIRRKKLTAAYRKIYTTLAVISASEIIVGIIIAVLLTAFGTK